MYGIFQQTQAAAAAATAAERVGGGRGWRGEGDGNKMGVGGIGEGFREDPKLFANAR